MPPKSPQESLIGRSGEIETIRQALSALEQGRGSTLLLAGEPGIGKSTLARHAVKLARERGAAVYCGYCWEAGGAPAYWPWTQLLRSLASEQSLDDAEKSALALLLPEYAATSATDEDLQPDQARFLLLDSVRMMLSRISEHTPLVLVFEDLHAADKDSLRLLRYLSRHVADLPILIIATYREYEARSFADSEDLWQMGRDATVLNLSRLTPQQVAEYLRSRTGTRPAASDVNEWFETTSGNPLFLSELVGLLDRGGRGHAVGGQLPATVEQVIGQQIGYLSEETVDLLSRASLLGKSFDIGALSVIAPGTKQELETRLAEARRAGIVVKPDAGRFEFSHGLYREVLYATLPAEDRALMHLRYARALKKRVSSGDEDGWSELATHLAAAGEEQRPEAIEAWRHAADRARSRLAFDEAANLLATAVDTFGEGPRFDPADRCELLLDCAEAMLLAGDIEGGHAKCEQAFSIARTIEDANLMAASALTYGSAIVVASVDQVLINMLRDCLDALPENDIAVRARVQARLAAALQPALDPSEPMDMAREAIEQARAVGDRSVLYDTLRSAISALMDFAPPEERRLLNEEFLARATGSGDVPAQFRSHLRLMIDAAELADRKAYDAAIDAAGRIAERIGLPHYQWRVASVRAMQAIIEGRYADALRCLDIAQELAERIDDLESRVTIPVQRFAVLHDWDSERAGTLDEIQAQLNDAYANGMEEASFFIQPFIEAFTVTDAKEAKKLIGNPAFVKRTFAGSDRFSIVAISLLAVVAEDRALAKRAFDALLEHENQCAVTGLLGSIWCGPVALELGRMSRFLGNSGEARSYFETALEVAQQMASKPFIARIHQEMASLAAESGDQAGARRHERIAGELFEALEMRPRGGLKKGRQSAATPAGFSIEPQGEVCKVSLDGQSALINNSKGLAMLVQLIERPDTDIHVLQLSGAGVAESPPGGDTGPALDAEARAAYKRRVQELREELEEAETMGDPARVDGLRGELDFITRELSRAFGLGGRERPQGRAAERARVNVRRRIKDAIDRIEEQLPGAGRYLENTIKTGSYCRYSPM